MPDLCENWVSTPGPKRITLESCDEIKLPIMYAYCLYAPNFEKVDGAYCFWSMRAWVTLFVPTVTFKPLKLES